MNDARSAVRRAALVGLKKLAEHAALWPLQCIQDLVRAATDSQDQEHTMLCLQVMEILVECPAICAAAGQQASALRQYCADAALSAHLPQAATACGVLTRIVLHWTVIPGVNHYLKAKLSAHLPQAATACGVLTRIVLHCYEESLPVDGSELMLALESLVIATGVDNDPTNIKPLRIALRCLVKLSIAEPTIYAARTATVLGIQLQECDWKQGGPRILALLEALGALGGSTYCPHSIAPAMPALLQTLDAAQKGEAPTDSSNDGTALVLLCTVLFQERAGTALTYKINSSWEQKILDTIRGVDGWTRYRVARAALRYGHQNLAADILKRLAEEAPSESAQRWLTALHRAASADALLLKEGISGLEAASSGWEVSSGWGGAGCGWGAGCAAACAGCGGCAPLPAAAMGARAQALAALARAAVAARAACTSMLPKVAGCGWGAGCAAACVGCGGCAPLPAAAMGARAQALAALARAAVAARAACTQPPPAIAHAHAQAARDPAAKAGACASATRRAARAVSAVAQRYAAIARTAFHADNTTLAHLHMYPLLIITTTGKLCHEQSAHHILWELHNTHTLN
ncbi:integrator complex subunit 7-like [Ostrinia furnacalis]|uniref:integrator complex subunit 7-like n=1 Tax=Ostrinia furnacalis TaxID=93504 RepID=UPI00103F9A35|nr:integrator complex subunit 7-like [Ostrinia furnacalis]